MQKEFDVLKGIIKEKCSRGNVYYLANKGNLGDALIRYGTIKFFQDIGLKYRERSKHKKDWILASIKGGTVIYGGGGAWCKLWNHSEKYVTRLAKRFDVIVLPSTYERNFSIPRTTFLCRDIFESKQNIPDAIFCHDMAFYIGKIPAPKGAGKGYFFRTDKESANKIKIPPDNIDISSQGNHLSDISVFIGEIAKYTAIYTDRLHIAIASCLLGKEVHIFPGSYFKNRAVYLSSMEGYFDNVYFHEDYAI